MSASNTDPAKSKGPRRRAPMRTDIGGTNEANRRATLVLEVLAGAQTPAGAAKQMGVTVPRYYSIEATALKGMVQACEVRGRGPMKKPEATILRLESEIVALRREVARLQALLRLSRQALAVKIPERKSVLPARSAAKPGQRAKRKPSARALKAVKVLRQEDAATETESGQKGDPHGPTRPSPAGHEPGGFSTRIG